MKKLFVVSILAISMLGCAHQVTAPVPGQLNTFDAYAFRVLADTQAAINSFKADIAKGTLAETPTVKVVLNQAITDYNVANATYQAWHAAGGNGPTTEVNAALTKVQSDVATVGGAR